MTKVSLAARHASKEMGTSVTPEALVQLLRRRVLIRSVSSRTHDFLAWLASPGGRLHHSMGFTITEDARQGILAPAVRGSTGPGTKDRG